MAIREIVLYPDPRLRQQCAPITEITPQILTLLDDMAETMYQAPGIGLAAPQVGALIRAIVVDVGNDDENSRERHLYKLLNPEIIERAGKVDYEEGCLSIPEVRESVRRSSEIVVEALNEKGEKIKIEATGLLAICLQHEIDHINGILFIDHLSKLKRELLRKKLGKIR